MSIPPTVREVRLASRPKGWPIEENFELGPMRGENLVTIGDAQSEDGIAAMAEGYER